MNMAEIREDTDKSGIIPAAITQSNGESNSPNSNTDNTSYSGSTISNNYSNNIMSIAHRGLSQYHTDNSLASFNAAIDYGFHMIELDIQPCATGEIVIYHDTYKFSKLIRDYTLDECKTLGIITLQEFFELINERNPEMKIYLDLKGNVSIASALCECLKSNRNIIQYENVYIASFNRQCLPMLKALRINDNIPIKLGFISETLYTISEIENLIEDISFISFHWTILDHSIIEYLKSKSIETYTYTCKEYFILSYMRQYNIDGIVTNFPWWTLEEAEEHWETLKDKETMKSVFNIDSDTDSGNSDGSGSGGGEGAMKKKKGDGGGKPHSSIPYPNDDATGGAYDINGTRY